MNSAHDLLDAIAHEGAALYDSTPLRSSHAGVAQRVRRQRIVRGAASTALGLAAAGACSWAAVAVAADAESATPASAVSATGVTPAPSLDSASAAPLQPLPEEDACTVAASRITDYDPNSYLTPAAHADWLCQVPGLENVELRGDAALALAATLEHMDELGMPRPNGGSGYKGLEPPEEGQGYLDPLEGTSRHWTGLVYDVGFTHEDQWESFAEVAAGFGWSRPLPDEPWHFEFDPEWSAS